MVDQVADETLHSSFVDLEGLWHAVEVQAESMGTALRIFDEPHAEVD
jgi:hypothetical protein